MGNILRYRAVLGLEPRNYPQVEERGQTIFGGLSGRPDLFVTPSPTLAVFQAKFAAFTSAQHAAVATRARGTAAARKACAGEFITCLETSRTYVQGLMDASTPDQATILATAAGMFLARASAYSKPALQAQQAAPSAAVEIQAHVGMLTNYSGHKVFFNWQSSADGGKTWVNAPSTPYGHTSIAGLTPLTTYAFRVSVTDAGGQGEWSQAVTLFVL